MNNEPSYFGLTNDHTWLSVSEQQYKKLKETHRMKCYRHPVKELTDEEIKEAMEFAGIRPSKELGLATTGNVQLQIFAKAILRKAQEK